MLEPLRKTEGSLFVEAVMDQRAAVFRSPVGAVRWGPRPLWRGWEPRFRDGVRGVHRGFYARDHVRVAFA
ncbi:MAG: hypothetical protein ACXWK4_02245, partial [Myxococcaceae bacterium]